MISKFILPNALTALFLCASSFAASTQETATVRHGDGEIDGLLKGTIELLIQSQASEETSAALEEPIQENIREMQSHREQVFALLREYARDHEDGSGRVKRATVMLLDRMNFTADDVMNYVLPRLTQGDEDKNHLYDLVSSFPSPDGEWSDYRFSLEFLRTQRDELAPEFVHEFYTLYPKRAVFQLIEAFIDNDEQKAALTNAAATIIQNSQMDLFLRGRTIDAEVQAAVVHDMKQLAASDEWWLRYFVAKALRYGPAYRDSELLNSLRSDSNPSVRSLLKSAK